MFITENTCILDLAFLVDSSGSIKYLSPDNWEIILNFVNNIIDRLSIGPSATQVALVNFATEAFVSIELNQFSDKNLLKAEVLRSRYQDGQTALLSALQLVRGQVFREENGARTGAARAIVIITDGDDTVDKPSVIPLANSLKADNIQIATVGITKAIDPQRLQAIASSPSFYFSVDNFSDLDSLVSSLSNLVCPASTTTSTTTTTTTLPPGQCFTNQFYSLPTHSHTSVCVVTEYSA